MRVLQIVTRAYRATLEEQDDTVLWLTHAMREAGGEFDVLLRRNAVNYAAVGQDASGLSIGDWHQTQPPQIPRDVHMLIEKHVSFFVAHEDLEVRGIDDQDLLPGIERLSQREVGRLLAGYDQVWQW